MCWLILRPDQPAKSSSVCMAASREDWSARNSVVSSAYCDIVMVLSAMDKPLIAVFFFIKKARSSTAIMKRDGEEQQLLLGLEKRKGKQNTVSSLKDSQGLIITDPGEILAAQRSYFEKIYTEDSALLQPLESLPISSEDLPKITEGHRVMTEFPFTHREFHTALKELGCNKAPGSDGITAEFYLKFWDTLHEPYFDCMSHAIETGILSPEQRSGIINLIPKKGLDRQCLGNWRPITLLNNDFKIYSKALSSRLQMCVKDIVSEDQTGFVKGRSIGTNLLTVQNLIETTSISGDQGLLLAIDYAKAFDSLRWDLIYKALELFGFGDFLISAVKLLFRDVKTSIFNSGFSSGYF